MNGQAATLELAHIERVSALVSDLLGLEISGLSAPDLLEMNDAVARLGRLAGALQARFAGEIAGRSRPELPGGGLARQHGFGNPQSLIARAAGGSTASALRAMEAGVALSLEPAGASARGVAGAPGVGGVSAGFEGVPGVGGEHGAAGAPGVEGEAGAAGHTGAPRHRYPAVAAAVLSGDLSVDAAGMIVAGLESITDRTPSEALHGLEARLAAKAVGLALHDVRRLVAHTVARADLEGHQQRERRNYQERYLSWAEDSSGMVTLSGRMDVVTFAPIRTVIEQVVTQGFRERREQDPLEQDRRTVGQMRADALFQMCRHALGCEGTARSGVRTTLVVRVGQSDLDSGRGLGTIDGASQPVSVGELRRVAGDAQVVAQVTGAHGEVLNLGRAKRMFTWAQRLALLERDGGCAKCHAPPEHCEAHHITWWERGGTTDLANGVMLCTRCHHDVHRQGWEIVATGTSVSFIPPPDVGGKRGPLRGGAGELRLNPRDPLWAELDCPTGPHAAESSDAMPGLLPPDALCHAAGPPARA